MRIYAAADIHARDERLTVIRDTIAREDPEVFVAAGDLTHYTTRPEVIQALDRLPLPVLAVRGNTDRKGVIRLIDHSPNITCPHLAAVALGTVEFVGISGTVALPFRSRIALREQFLMAAAAELIGPQTVLVAHPPPWGVQDRVLGLLHAGSRLLRNLLLRCRPRVLVCGHIHEQAGTATLGETLVVNCSMGRGGAGALIELAPDHPPRVEMLH